MSKCIGCGIKLQDSDINTVGYTKKLDNLYCERCFKTIHYNEEKKVSNIDNSKIIDKINKLGCMTIFITDLISINKELINVFKSINNKKMLLINKCDIIPNNLKLEHIEENIKNSFKIDEEVCFISAKKEYNLNRVINIIEEEGKVIFCGETSSGKSTLINKLTGKMLTTSKYSNTTLDFIKIKYLDYIIYDSPGIMINENKLCVEKIKVMTIKLDSDYVYNIDNYLVKGSGNITLFVNDNVKVSSRKSDILLDYKLGILDGEDIELDNGFIFVKNKCNIRINKLVGVRKSIISK